jgi:GH15 family glucan-1,4-alpha-glucosidase
MRSRVAFLLASVVALAACTGSSSDDGTGSSEDEVRWEPISALLGNPPNFAQLGNGSAMSVVSRAEGRGSKAGALVELYYPQYAKDNLWDSYVGLRSKGQKLRWAHQLDLKAQRVVDDTGLVQSDFAASGLTMRIEDVMRPGNDAHVRHVVVTNTSSAALEDAEVAFYAFYTLKDLPTGDRIRFDAASGALVQVDDDVAVATVGDRPPVAQHCGNALAPLGSQKDARGAAEQGKLSGCPTPIDAGLSGVNGVLVHALGTIAPGETKDISYAIGLGRDESHALDEAEKALAGGFDARAAEDRAHWKNELARAEQPAALPATSLPVYRRALVTMLQHRVDNGAFIAAPTLTSPVYRFVWPRDGSKTAIDLLEAGYQPEAKAFFEFLEKLLLPDGSFAVNYFADGSKPFFDFGASGNENDQPGMLPWGVDKVYAASRDRPWLAARWPAVRRVAEHMLDMSATSNGLVKPSRDLWELETGSSWTYANGSAVAGLQAAARIAREVGMSADGARYDARAASISAMMDAKLVTTDGYWARGLKGTTIDTRLEIGNLALGAGGFALYPDTDPRLVKVGDLVRERLLTPSGGVKRYEGDRYYGGQPWPVAAAWLAMHELARGERPIAEAEFASMTRQALATDSRMLGEQFDESKNEWVSAMPLVWSEAAYVRTALALYRAP